MDQIYHNKKNIRFYEKEKKKKEITKIYKIQPGKINIKTQNDPTTKTKTTTTQTIYTFGSRLLRYSRSSSNCSSSSTSCKMMSYII